MNMSRLFRAEQEVIHMTEQAKFGVKEINFFRLQNAAVLIFCAQKWVRIGRRTLAIRARRAAAAAQNRELDLE